MEETKELIFKSMREASKYFCFPYSGKMSDKDRRYLACYCEWEKINKNLIRVTKIYDTPKELQLQCTREYKYKVGDIISSTNSSFRVLKQIRIYREKMSKGKKEIINEKGYLVKCIRDGYEFEVLESALSRNYGCVVCSNRKIIKGINDVATTHPEIAELFENIEDAYTTSYSTAKKFRFKCPRCGHVKLDDTNHITFFGFSCPNCSDGISYPNKFMAKLLSDINVDFDREIKFDWCTYPCFIDNEKMDYGTYDFVIENRKLIIEMDGGLGHGKRVMSTISHNRRKISLEETVYRDKMKDILAKENGYKLIRIDCEYPSDIEKRFKVVKNNILDSELSEIFDFSNVDFDEIDKFCLNDSYVTDVAKLWNKGFSPKQIETEMKLSSVTVGRYLKICKRLELCDYSPEKGKIRGNYVSSQRSPYSVLYNNKLEIFSSFSELKRYYSKNYNIKLNDETIKRYIDNDKLLHDRKFTKLTKEEFNKYYNDRSLADLVVGEAFLIA